VRARVAWLAALLAALLVQTALIPPFIPEAWRPDFTRSLVLWLALTGVPGGGVYLSFVAGLAVDLVSGGPPGFTAVCRLAVYFFARPWRGVFELRGIIFIIGPFAVLADIGAVLLLKNVIFLNQMDSLFLVSIGARQILVEIFAVPLAFAALEKMTGYKTEEQLL
jgi:cell shape-determining protein MreD